MYNEMAVKYNNSPEAHMAEVAMNMDRETDYKIVWNANATHVWVFEKLANGSYTEYALIPNAFLEKFFNKLKYRGFYVRQQSWTPTLKDYYIV